MATPNKDLITLSSNLLATSGGLAIGFAIVMAVHQKTTQTVILAVLAIIFLALGALVRILVKSDPYGREDEDDEEMIEEAIVSRKYLVMPAPDEFEALIKGSRLTAEQWYKAIYIVQHNGLDNMQISPLAKELNVQYATAQLVLNKLRKLGLGLRVD